MYPITTDGRLQVMAGVSLIEHSHLMTWDACANRFKSVLHDDFESDWRRDVDPVSGRLICWINFSAGAEFLAKGVCLLNGVEIRKPTPKEIPANPSKPLGKWAKQFRVAWKPNGIDKITNYGTLGELTSERAQHPLLEQLCQRCQATQDNEDRLIAAYKLLALRIRNRDAHAYVPNVRDSSFWLVSDLFLDCFNLLVSWLPGGCDTLNKWRDSSEAKRFIDSLP